MFEKLENKPGLLLAMYAERVFLTLASKQHAVTSTSSRLKSQLDYWFTELFCRIDDMFVPVYHEYYGNRPVFWNFAPLVKPSGRFVR
jgi:hypothetical protein